MNNLSIVTVATKSYQYALVSQIRAIKQNLDLADVKNGNMIFVTDEENVDKYINLYKKFLGDSWQIHHIPLKVKDGNINYKENAQLVIAQLFTAGFDKAKELKSDYVWSLESDVIPEANNLRCMRDMLLFDGGYYDVSFVPYISQGKAGIMGGRGTETNNILPNIHEDEYDVPNDLAEKIKEHKSKLEPGKQPDKTWMEKMQYFKGEIERCQPKGNVFKLNGEKWRKRGWLEFAYPGIGKGAVLPSDWMPTGNNLFSKKALNYIDFVGYEGRGTQDLYLTFHRLKQHGIQICALPHCVSHHVVREKGIDGKTNYKIMMLRHEPDGEFEGHLRQSEREFFNHEPGEEYPVRLIPEDYSI